LGVTGGVTFINALTNFLVTAFVLGVTLSDLVDLRDLVDLVDLRDLVDLVDLRDLRLTIVTLGDAAAETKFLTITLGVSLPTAFLTVILGVAIWGGLTI
jgi:hypothetical protein